MYVDTLLMLATLAWGATPPDAEWVLTLPTGDAAAALNAQGCTVEAQAGVAAQARCPDTALASLRALPGARVRAPEIGRPKGTSDADRVETEGYDAIFARDWHAAGITGKHVTVGIIDVGFAGYEDLLGTELPVDVETDFRFGDPSRSSHGTAVAEVIHDLAPDAALVLVTFATDVEFAQSLNMLANRGVDVVNGSIGFDNVWAADGSSLPSFAVTSAAEMGVIYVAAAGNEDEKYSVGELTRPDPSANEVWLGGVATHTAYTRDGFAAVRFRWSEPFGAASTDIDLYLLNAAGEECGRSARVQDGTGDPVEYVSTSFCTDDVVFPVLRLRDPEADVTGLRGWLYGDYGVAPEDQTHRDSLTVPADAIGAFSIGAVDANEEVPAWSSRGPTDDGREKPDFVAPTGVSTATLGDLGLDGTSAAAPHAAGLAALWISATHRYADPDGFRAWATENAIDLAPDGLDRSSGAGALHADAVPERVCGCDATASSPHTASLLLVVAPFGVLWSALRRRPQRARWPSASVLCALFGLSACADKPVDAYIVVVSSRVVDESGAPLADVRVTLGTPDGEIIAILYTDALGQWTCPIAGTALDGNELRALYDMEGHTQGIARYVLNLRSPTLGPMDPGPWQTWQTSKRQLPTMQLAEAVEIGGGDGRLITTLGAPVGSAAIALQRGWNAPADAPVLATVTTGDDGRFALHTTPGWWTASVEPDVRHGPARFGVFVGASTIDETVNAPGVVPPVWSADSPWLTATVTWAPHPLDLDLHVTSPLRGGLAGEDGSGVFHVWSGDPRHPENTAAAAEGELLIADDDGTGPETIVVYSAPEEGETHVAVLDNDDFSDPESEQLGLGRVQVQVWLADQEPAYFSASPGTVGTLWRPLEIESETVYAVEDYEIGVAPDDAAAI